MYRRMRIISNPQSLSNTEAFKHWKAMNSIVRTNIVGWNKDIFDENNMEFQKQSSLFFKHCTCESCGLLYRVTNRGIDSGTK